MKFQPEDFGSAITGYGPGWVAVDREKFEHSLLVGAKGLRQAWDCVRFEDLTPEHFEALSQLDAEVIILGSGQRNRFPPAAWLRYLRGGSSDLLKRVVAHNFQDVVTLARLLPHLAQVDAA